MAIDDELGIALTPTVRFTSPGYLLNKVGVVAARWIADAFGSLPITPRQGAILLALRTGGPMAQSELARALGYDASTMVLLLNDLERGGLIVRRRDDEDRRRHIVSITAEGRRCRRAADAAVTDVEERLLGDLDDAERATLRELLLRVHGRTRSEDVPGLAGDEG